MSIFIKPIGGLASQLFIWATGLALKTRVSSGSLVALTTTTILIAGTITSWTVSTLVYLRYLTRTISIRWRRQNKALSTVCFSKICSAYVGRIIGSRISYMPGILQLPDNSYLRGYFQSWKYFDGHQEEVRSRVRKLSNPSVWFSERAQELRASPTWIGVHFRWATIFLIQRWVSSTRSIIAGLFDS